MQPLNSAAERATLSRFGSDSADASRSAHASIAIHHHGYMTQANR